MVVATEHRLAAVDVYIDKAAPFAQPILTHVRELIHASVPDVEEAIKWSMPFFVYKGIILAHAAAFKAHCSFDIWKEGMQPATPAAKAKGDQGMGSFGKLMSVKDLPANKELKARLIEAAGKIDRGERTRNWEGRVKKGRPEAEVPAALAAGLKKHPAAGECFAAMSPSCRREYCEWIGEAKREGTRVKRVEQALAMIAEGKGRHWRHEARL